MGAGGTIDFQRAELKGVLSSKTFARSQRLIKLLEYISEKHFAGEGEQVCEYSIATEVLGRPDDFDPAEDAISRVEIHRLRKKLRDYYATEGADRPVKIVVPPGMYTPVFLQEAGHSGNGSSPAPPPAENSAALPEAPAPPVKPRAGGRNRLWFAGLPLAVMAILAVWLWTTKTGKATVAPSGTLPPPLAVTDSAVRIIAGYDRPSYIDRDGHTWQADRFYEGGGPWPGPLHQFVARTSDPPLYEAGRYGVYAYNIPLKPGNYELKLHFLERVYGPGLETGGGENSRVMDVTANGQMLLKDFDIVSDAGGPDIADVRVFKDIRPGPDGYLRLGFHAKRERPFINAIEIEPALPHRLNPIRIATQPNSVTDSQGHVWMADTYYMGGQASNHWKGVTGTPDPDLFNNERYGHFSYAIPVASGSYTVNLYFAETFWGPNNGGGGGIGSRVFDVYCNGLALLYNFDIFKEAGANTALVKRFRGLRPNPQGKLNLEFVPVSNYASLFALKVLDESR